MPLPEDIRVERDLGARTQQPYIPGILKIGIIGRSRGKNTSSTVTVTRQVADTDLLKNYTTDVYASSPIRSVDKAVDLETGKDEIYYPGIHFNIIKSADDSILSAANLGSNDDPTALEIDWSVAAPLVPPSVANTSLQSSSTGGFDSATTVYYALTVVDHNSNESNVGSLTKVEIPAPTTGYYQVILTWRMVEYATGYNVYKGTAADGSDLLKIGTVSVKTTVTFTDYNIVGSGSPPTTNTTAAKPKDGDTYDLYYDYAVVTRMKAVEYTTPGQVKADHGVGSELTNVAKIFMSSVYNNTPVVVTVVPESDTYNSYLDAANVFKTAHVNFIVSLYAGSDTLATLISNLQPFYNLCASLSDEKVGQKECYAAFALPYKAGWTTNDVKTFCNAYQSTATKGKRAFFVVPDGFYVKVQSWELSTGVASSNYTVTDPSGYDITPFVFAGACMARYAGLRDSAEPLTEKDILGFTFHGDNFTNQEIRAMRSYSAMVVENISGIAAVNQSINMSWSSLGIEDGEMNICVTEDRIKEDLRSKLRKYRGKKQLGAILRAAEDTIADALRQYIDNKLIAYFDAKSVTVYQDPNQKDRILGSFIYMPIYPINQIAVSYLFVFVAL